MADKPLRIAFIPDTQVKDGVPLDNLDWIGQAVADYKPDVVVHGGDHWDNPSFGSYDKPGSKAMEGARHLRDIEVGNEAFARLCKPIEREQKRDKKWKLRKEFLFGNHENRADRAAASDAKLLGVVGTEFCDTRDWKRNPFLKRLTIGGVTFSHYFQSSHSSFAIGGSIDNRLNKIGCSFVQGHEQGFRYAPRIYASGKTVHGLVAGSAYLHEEGYRGAQGQEHWRGIIILNDVNDGDYDILPLRLKYLCRKYEGVDLVKYMSKKYPKQDWEHLSV